MTEATEPQWSRVEAALLALTQSVQRLAEETQATNRNIDCLVEHLFTRRDVVAEDVVDIKNELFELKEVAKLQNSTADRYAIAAEKQAEAAAKNAETAQTQAENLRLLIEMLNRRQA
jgi:hypothetical protein